MEFTIKIDDARKVAGLTKYLAEFNAQNKEPITAAELLAKCLETYLTGWANQYDIATTTDVDMLREAVKADPMAVKASIIAQEQKEADAAKAEPADVDTPTK